MPAVMTKPSFESVGKMKGKKVSKEYGGDQGQGDDSSSSPKKAGFPGKRPGGKRSFLQKAKRFEKQGRLGKGFKIEQETYSYYVRILEQLRNDDFESDEDRDILVENSLNMAEGEEVQLASNQLVSRVLENLLPLASEERIEKFGEALLPSLRVIVADSFASHVLEKLLEMTSSDKWRSSKKLTAWFEKTAMFVLNNFEDFTFDTYANFVMKKVIECLSGHVEKPADHMSICHKKGSTSNTVRLELYGDRTRNPKWEKILHDFAKRFCSWPQFNDLKNKVETSRLIQNIIQTVSRTENSGDLLKDIILRILAILPESLDINDLAHRTLEVAFSVADTKTFAVIYDKYYKGRLADYVNVEGQCFTIHKLVTAAPSAKHFTNILTELIPLMDSIMKAGKIIVIADLATQCVKYETMQTELWNSVKKAFKKLQKSGTGHTNILWTILTLQPGKESSNEKFSTTFYGSSAIQSFLDFQAPVITEVLESFEELKTGDIMKVCLDPKASHIITKMFRSWQVSQDSKVNLFNKLSEDLHLVELANTKFGSRIIDLIWLWADVEQKSAVAAVLSQRIPMLTSNNYGRFLVETIGLQAYVRNKKEWTEHIKAQIKREQDSKKIAAGLATIGDNEAKTPKKNKKRKSEAQETLVGETPPSKKDKKRKSEVTADIVDQSNRMEETTTPKKSKKNRKSQVEISETMDTSLNEESLAHSTETPKKKKKKNKNRDSESGSQEVNDAEQIPQISETPSKKKRKSEKAPAETEEVAGMDSTPNKKKKNRSSKKF